MSSIPDALQAGIEEFLSDRPDWDLDRVNSAALSLFLLQNEPKDHRKIARIYLDSIFQVPTDVLGVSDAA